MLQGLVNFTKGPAAICVINLTEHDLILKSGQVVADLSPIELSSQCTTNTEPFFDPKQGIHMKAHAFIHCFQHQ